MSNIALWYDRNLEWSGLESVVGIEQGIADVECSCGILYCKESDYSPRSGYKAWAVPWRVPSFLSGYRCLIIRMLALVLT